MDIDDAVRGYVCEVVACSPDRITGVRRFPSGERHAVYKVSYVDSVGVTNDLVVRISLSNDADERARAQREARVLDKVHGVAAPRLLDFRVESRWFDVPTMSMAFVRGAQRELAAVAPDDMERLGSAVGWIHGLPVDDLADGFRDSGTSEAYRQARVERVAGYMPSVRDPLPAAVQHRLHHALQMVNESLTSFRSADRTDVEERLVLLHGDVASGNIIWSPEPVLIDWEYARLGDPADEVAYLFSQNGLAPSHREAFWAGYGRTANLRERVERVVDDVAWWEPVTLLGSALWWVERWSRRAGADATGVVDPTAPKSPDYYLDQALRRLARFEALFQRDVRS